MGALMVRRRTGLSRNACVLAAARGHYEGLRLPGPVSAGTRWHARLAVVVLPGELRVAGSGGLWRYLVSDMVLASVAPDGAGAIRVDFLEGDPLVVTVRDGGALLAALRHQVEQYERAIRHDRPLTARLVRDHLTGADLEVSVHALTPAIGLLYARRTRPPDSVPMGGWATNARETSHRAQVEALRAGRRNLLTSSRLPA